MAILSVVEQAREGTHLLGSTPELVRTIRVELTAPVNISFVVQAAGVTHGSPHPDLFGATVYSLEVQEELIDPSDLPDEVSTAVLATTIVAKYRVEVADDTDQLPWLRQSIWKFQTQGVAVPALFYFDGSTQKPLTNSAGDYFEGLTVDEAQQKITIQTNRQSFPSALAAAITNCVNNGTYLGFPADRVKVQGISGERAVEVVNDQEVNYWKITAELLARQTGWNLLLPDIGFNFIDGGVRKRATVELEGEKIASANPVALNGSGGLVAGGGLPSILNRRVYPQIAMSEYFGTPPS